MALYRRFPRYVDFTDFTPVIPEIYWNVYSSEQRIRALCCEWVKLVAYVDGMADTVNDQYKIIEDMEARLPELVNEDVIAEIQRLVNSGKFKQLIEQAIADFEAEIRDDITALNTGLSNEATARANADGALDARISKEVTARVNADGALSARIDNEEDARIAADNAISNRITNLETEYALFIGDSYLRGTGTTDGPSGGEGFNSIGNGWGKYVQPLIGIPSSNIYCIGGGGAGFVSLGVNGGGNGLNFEGMLDKAISEMTSAQRNATKYVIVAGGINDGSDITLTAINNFASKVRSNFPKAKKYMCTNSGNGQSGFGKFLLTKSQRFAYNRIKHGCASGGFGYIPTWKATAFQSNLYNADNVHLTDTGYAIFGRYIVGAINGGASYIRNYNMDAVEITFADNVTATDNQTLFVDDNLIAHFITRSCIWGGDNISGSGANIATLPKEFAPLTNVDYFCLVQNKKDNTLQLGRITITASGAVNLRPCYTVTEDIPSFSNYIYTDSTIYLPPISWPISY